MSARTEAVRITADATRARAWRFAASALATVVPLLLATLGSGLMRDNVAVAGSLAAVVALGAGCYAVASWGAAWRLTAAWRMRPPSPGRVILRSLIRGAGLLAALAVLAAGALQAGMAVAPAAPLRWALAISSSRAVPVAAVLLLLAGLSHLPWRAMPPAVAPVLALPPATAWALAGHRPGAVLACAAASLVSVLLLVRALHRHGALQRFARQCGPAVRVIARALILVGLVLLLVAAVLPAWLAVAPGPAGGAPAEPLVLPAVAGIVLMAGLWLVTGAAARAELDAEPDLAG